jgi:hypothetical protein
MIVHLLLITVILEAMACPRRAGIAPVRECFRSSVAGMEAVLLSPYLDPSGSRQRRALNA